MKLQERQCGQGMTEYIIIVALIAIAAIGVYQAFGGIIRGQTAVAAQTLAGGGNFSDARNYTNQASDVAGTEGSSAKGLKNFHAYDHQ